MTCIQIPGGILCVQPTFKPGDPAPEGYINWHEWAAVQHTAGLRQKKCPACLRWKYPQEMHDVADVCNKCSTA